MNDPGPAQIALSTAWMVSVVLKFYFIDPSRVDDATDLSDFLPGAAQFWAIKEKCV